MFGSVSLTWWTRGWCISSQFQTSTAFGTWSTTASAPTATGKSIRTKSARATAVGTANIGMAVATPDTG